MSDHTCDHVMSCGCHNRLADLIIHDLPKRTTAARQAAANGTAIHARTISDPVIFHAVNGGEIITMKNGDPNARVEALVMYEGKIIATGLYKHIKAMQEAFNVALLPTIVNWQEYKVEGPECLIPGLIEPHVHIVPTAVMLSWHDYSPYGETSFADRPAEQHPASALAAQVLRPDYSLKSLQKAMDTDVQKFQSRNEKIPDDRIGERFWLLGNSVDPSLMLDFLHGQTGKQTILNCIDASYLDEVSDLTPILVGSASGHTVYANTPALKIIWRRQNQKNEWVSSFKNEQAFIDDTAGVLQELDQLKPAFDSLNEEQTTEYGLELNNNINAFIGVALKRGVTMIYDAASNESSIGVLQEFLDTVHRHAAPIRIGMARLVESLEDVDALPAYERPVAPNDATPYGHQSLNLFSATCKIVSDGSNQGLTGYQDKIYSCNPSPNFGVYNFLDQGTKQDISVHGNPNKPPTTMPDPIKHLVEASWSKGWPIMMHANGDKAISYALDAFETAQASCGMTYPPEYQRNRIEHCSLVDDVAMGRIRELKLAPSFLIGHVGYWGWIFDSYIFAAENGDGHSKAWQQLDRCGSCVDPQHERVRFSLHSDCGVSPLGPLRFVEQAVTRKMEGSPQALKETPIVADIPVLNEKEQVSPGEALRSVTYDAAWQCHADEFVGELVAGKQADMVWLAQNPLNSKGNKAYLEIRKIPVKQVFVGGKAMEVTL